MRLQDVTTTQFAATVSGEQCGRREDSRIELILHANPGARDRARDQVRDPVARMGDDD